MGFDLELFFNDLFILLTAAKNDVCTIDEVMREVEGYKEYAKNCGQFKEDK